MRVHGEAREETDDEAGTTQLQETVREESGQTPKRPRGRSRFKSGAGLFEKGTRD